MKSKLRIGLLTMAKDKREVFEAFLGVLGLECELTVYEPEAGAKTLLGEEELVRRVSSGSLAAFESGEHDWGVAMEGGFCEILGGLYIVCLVCIRTEKGSFLGISSKVRLPVEIETAVRRGIWIGEVLDKYQARYEKKEHTNELCQMIRTRRELFTQALSNAWIFERHEEEISR